MSTRTRLRFGLVTACVLVFGGLLTSGQADEPGRLGRLFRFGPQPKPSAPAPSPDPLPLPPATELAPISPSATPRIRPQPRVSRPATEADPLVTRIAIGRSDDGKQFGMFLQVFADGTVIDTEGTHRVGPEAMRPVVQAIQSGELGRLKGHCGGPSTDFVELVHVVVYERSLGRLRANSFSYSGNPQGCDASIRQLQATLDALQAKLTPTSAPATPIVASPGEAKPITLDTP